MAAGLCRLDRSRCSVRSGRTGGPTPHGQGKHLLPEQSDGYVQPESPEYARLQSAATSVAEQLSRGIFSSAEEFDVDSRKKTRAFYPVVTRRLSHVCYKFIEQTGISVGKESLFFGCQTLPLCRQSFRGSFMTITIVIGDEHQRH